MRANIRGKPSDRRYRWKTILHKCWSLSALKFRIWWNRETKDVRGFSLKKETPPSLLWSHWSSPDSWRSVGLRRTVSFGPLPAVNVSQTVAVSRHDGVGQGSPLRQAAADLQSLLSFGGIKLTHVWREKQPSARWSFKNPPVSLRLFSDAFQKKPTVMNKHVFSGLLRSLLNSLTLGHSVQHHGDLLIVQQTFLQELDEHSVDEAGGAQLEGLCILTSEQQIQRLREQHEPDTRTLGAYVAYPNTMLAVTLRTMFGVLSSWKFLQRWWNRSRFRREHFRCETLSSQP